MLLLHINVYVIDKTWHEYEPNQTMDYVVNVRLIMSNMPAMKAILTRWAMAAANYGPCLSRLPAVSIA